MGRQSLKHRAGRNAVGAKEITKQRTAALDQMNSQLQRKFTQIERSVNDLRADNLRYYYKIGKICEVVRNNPQQYLGHDGTPGLKLIEQALSTQARTLRKAAMFAREYDAPQLDELISFFHKDTNYQLHWGHVSFLLSLPTPEQRRRFALEAVNNMLDPPALHDLIKRKTNRAAGHGRKHEMPKTIAAQIRQMHAICKQWVGKDETVWNGTDAAVFSNIIDMAPDTMTHEMVEQLEEVKEFMVVIAERAGENVDRAARAIEHMTGCIEQCEEQRKALQDSGREPRAIDLVNDGTGRRTRGSKR